MKSFKKIEEIGPRILTARYGNLLPTTVQSVEVTQSTVNPESVARFIRKYQIATPKFCNVIPRECGQKLKTMV